MRESSPHISLAATMIYWRSANFQCKCTWAEQSTSTGPSCGEILGGAMTKLILNAAASTYHDTIPLVVVDCDNNGVESHRNNPFSPLPTNQSQADILWVLETSSLSSLFMPDINTPSHMPTTQRDGRIIVQVWRAHF